MRLPDDWDKFLDGLPPNPPAPTTPPIDDDEDLDYEGPLAEATSLVECIEDMIADARNSINLADDLLTDLKALLESGEIRDVP